MKEAIQSEISNQVHCYYQFNDLLRTFESVKALVEFLEDNKPKLSIGSISSNKIIASQMPFYLLVPLGVSVQRTHSLISWVIVCWFSVQSQLAFLLWVAPLWESDSCFDLTTH